MTALYAVTRGALMPVKRGDLDRIAEKDTGYVPAARGDTWINVADQDALHRVGTRALHRLATPGRDCPACTCPRDRHDGWGCRDCSAWLPCSVPHWRLVGRP